MTMIPPKIKKLPKLHKPTAGYVANSPQINKGLYNGGKMVR